MTTLIYVTYEGGPSDRFDRDYYVRRHLPLVEEAFRKYGLIELSAFFPAVARKGTVALCECRFRDADAVATAFGSPEAGAVHADVVNFTDIEPLRLRGIPMNGSIDLA